MIWVIGLIACLVISVAFLSFAIYGFLQNKKDVPVLLPSGANPGGSKTQCDPSMKGFKYQSCIQDEDCTAACASSGVQFSCINMSKTNP